MTKDMTQGSPLKLILAFAVPLMLGSLFQQFYNLADTIIVGRFVGVEALAAVGSVGGLNYLVLGFVNGIACGFSIPISWTFGAKDYKEMRRYTANTVWLSVAFAVVLTVVTVALTRSVLVWTNTPANIIDIADIYIRTIFWGIPFTLLYNVTSALMRALGDSKRPLYFLLVASALNIGLDLVCIIVFRMGAFGAAFATVFSQAVAGIGSLVYILRHYHELRWSKDEGAFSLPHCAKLCSMGIPMGLQCSITAIGSVVLQGAVNGLGSDIVAAQTAGGKAAQFLCVPLESIGTAMTTYTSQNMGAKDLDRDCHHGQRPEFYFLEQRVLHPPGGADHLSLHHPGPGLFQSGHVCRGGRDDRPGHGGRLVRAPVGVLCRLHRKPGGLALCLLLPDPGLHRGAQAPAEQKTGRCAAGGKGLSVSGLKQKGCCTAFVQQPFFDASWLRLSSPVQRRRWG